VYKFLLQCVTAYDINYTPHTELQAAHKKSISLGLYSVFKKLG